MYQIIVCVYACERVCMWVGCRWRMGVGGWLSVSGWVYRLHGCVCVDG